jgi:hypothetical protein
MSGARRAIRRPRARLSAGIRRSRTASCSNTPTCPAIWRRGWAPSSSMTTTPARAHKGPSNLTPRRRLLRPRRGHPARAGADQTPDPGRPSLALSRAGCLTSNPDGPEPPLRKPATRLKSSDDEHTWLRARAGTLSQDRQEGWVAERSMAAVLKTARGQPLVGSNPTPSANWPRKSLLCQGFRWRQLLTLPHFFPLCPDLQG